MAYRKKGVIKAREFRVSRMFSIYFVEIATGQGNLVVDDGDVGGTRRHR
jgi:hypothetical protein